MDECAVMLTKDEIERLTAIVAYNLDANLVPDMMECAKRGDTEKVLGKSKAIEFDRNLNQKLLNAL